MASEASYNSGTFRERMESEEKLLKERNFLRNFNLNFDSYKKDINKVFFERDEQETKRLNEIAQPKFVYNNYPLILGIIFFIFGILLVMSSIDDGEVDNTMVQTPAYNTAPNVTYMMQPKYTTKSKPTKKK
jgi:hypothetical protein